MTIAGSTTAAGATLSFLSFILWSLWAQRELATEQGP